MLNLNGGSWQRADLCVCWNPFLPQINMRCVIKAKNKTNRPLLHLFVLLQILIICVYNILLFMNFQEIYKDKQFLLLCWNKFVVKQKFANKCFF